MDERRAWIKSKRKKRLRLLAVALCFCLLVTTHPNILETLSVFALKVRGTGDSLYISDFSSLPEEVREQTVPVGTAFSELTLPDTLEAFVTVEESVEESDEVDDTGAEKESGDTEGTEDENSDAKEAGDEDDGIEETEILENTQASGTQEESVTIEGVTWQSGPEYDGNTEGVYIFTAVLPEVYMLEEGVSLPQITVTVQECDTDTLMQTLPERIAESTEQQSQAEAKWEDDE